MAVRELLRATASFRQRALRAEGKTLPTKTVLHPVHPRGIDRALTSFPDVELVQAESGDGVHEALVGGAPVLATVKWEDRFLQPGLRWVAGEGAGFEQYPLDAFKEQGVILTSAKGVHTSSVAEHAIALLLALSRRISDNIRSQAHGEWQPQLCDELTGSTVGILGLGEIGEAIAARLANWEVDTIGLKRSPSDYDGVVGEVLGPPGLLELCERVDNLIVTLPQSTETVGMIGDRELAALGSGRIINVGRGSVVDEEALVSHLANGVLSGAGLDVFEEEPLPAESPLWEMEHVIITPHSAGDSPQYGERWLTIFAKNIKAFHGEGAWINRII